MSLKSCFARPSSQTAPLLESKRSGRNTELIPLSRLVSAAVNLHDFTHLALNLGPRVLRCTGLVTRPAELGRLLSRNLRSLCSTCAKTGERCELFFLFPGQSCGDSSSSLVHTPATRTHTHSGNCGVSNSAPNRTMTLFL